MLLKRENSDWQSRIIHFLVIGALLLIVHLPLNLVFWYMHCYDNVRYSDARSEYPFFSMHCNVSPFVHAQWRCRCRRRLHRIIIIIVIVVVVVVVNTMFFFVLQLLLFDSHCFQLEWKKSARTHTHQTFHYTLRSR